MNGAESLVHTLLKSGVDTCFCNPGTSEMHFVAALDRIAGTRRVLVLFEGGRPHHTRLQNSRDCMQQSSSVAGKHGTRGSKGRTG